MTFIAILTFAFAALLLLLFLSQLIDLALAADGSVSSGGSCIVKSGDGSYTYSDVTKKGPKRWGGIKGFETCGRGKLQSPIDFPVSENQVRIRRVRQGPAASMVSAVFQFAPGNENWALNCVQARKCGSTIFNGVRYYVANIHLHTPAEHTLNGKQYPLESHIVHTNWARDKFIVIATMFEYPAFNDYSSTIYRLADEEYGVNLFLKSVLDAVVNDRPSFLVNLGQITDLKQGSCAYRGSLTTPPCNEAVTFLMQMKTQTVSREQVHLYHLTVGGGLHGNNRPVQPINGRKLTCYVEK